VKRAVLCALLGASALLASGSAAAASSSGGFSLPLPAGTPPDVRALVDSQVETGHGNPSRKSVRHEFNLRGSHHYSIEVFAEGNSVLVEVGRRHDHSLTAYAVKGTVTHSRIQADLGALGSVSMRFHPGRSRRSVSRRHFCGKVPRTVDRRGTYTGLVRIRGEDGYVSVAARRAKGKLETSSDAPCIHSRSHHRDERSSGSSHHEGRKVKRPRLLFAGWRAGPNSVTFAALTFRDRTHLVALTDESTGRMGIFHFASITAPPRIFALDNALTRAKLSARKPFTGTGIYTAAPDGSTAWEGSLSVDFPGTPAFPLTGPQFEVEVEAGFGF
jgi:hypothetical protein